MSYDNFKFGPSYPEDRLTGKKPLTDRGGPDYARAMRLEDHMIRTLAEHGTQAAEIHIFMDQYFRVWPCAAHRVMLHHRTGVDLVAKRSGEWARGPALTHVKDDFGFVPEGPAEVLSMVNAWPSQVVCLISELERVYGTDFGIEET